MNMRLLVNTKNAANAEIAVDVATSIERIKDDGVAAFAFEENGLVVLLF